MKFYHASRPLYLKTDASNVGLGASLLQVNEGMNCGHDQVPDNATLPPVAFASKSLSSSESQFSNIEWEAHGILHGLEKFHHCCIAKGVYVKTDYKPLVAMVSKDVTI